MNENQNEFNNKAGGLSHAVTINEKRRKTY